MAMPIVQPRGMRDSNVIKVLQVKKNAKIGPDVATATNLTCARMFGKAWGKFSFRRLDSHIFYSRYVSERVGQYMKESHCLQFFFGAEQYN